MRFVHAARLVDIQPIIGAEVTLQDGSHLLLLAETAEGYDNLSRLLSYAHIRNPRGEPALDPLLFKEHARGLIALSGCPKGGISTLLTEGRAEHAEQLARSFLDWFGTDHFFLELQQNLVRGDRKRNNAL